MQLCAFVCPGNNERGAACASETGSYSYVAIGASAKTYDQLGAPVARRLLFAGEHTAKEHPDTVRAPILLKLRPLLELVS